MRPLFDYHCPQKITGVFCFIGYGADLKQHFFVENDINSTDYTLKFVNIDTELTGDVYLLPAGHNHRYASSRTNPWEKIWMNVYGPLCDVLFATYHLEHVYHSKDLDLYPLFLRFLGVCEQKDTHLQDILQESSLIFHEILSEIGKHTYTIPFQGNPAVYRVREYIDRNAQDKMTMDTLAKIACLSGSHRITSYNVCYTKLLRFRSMYSLTL